MKARETHMTQQASRKATGSRKHLRLWAAALAALFFSILATPLLSTPAVAQEQQQRRTLFQMLFGQKNRSVVIIEEAPVRKQRKANRARTTPGINRAAVAEKPEVVEKLPDAKKVLVVGDFLAGGLGEGLEAAFEQSGGTVIDIRSNGSSGVVRDDYYNWFEELPKLIADIRPAVVVIAMGANDRQQYRNILPGEKFRSEKWSEEYTRRVAALAKIARQDQRPLLWVGMPPFQSSSMTADMVTLNGFFRSESEKAGGQFIDIWDGFVDEEGKFIVTGSDINGQQVRLRGSDGINLTKAGKRKIAFYVEKEIRRLLGDNASAESGALASTQLNDIVVDPAANADIVRTQPISLADPELDGGSVLLGASLPKRLDGKSPRDLLVERGEVSEAPAGRVDDFRLSKPAAGEQSASQSQAK